jgi:hypothetical protein
MNLKMRIAKRYLPPRLKLKGLLHMYFDLAYFLYKEMKNQNMNSSGGFHKACAEVGTASAQTMREELHLKDTVEDAVSAWIIGSKAMNVTLSLERRDDEVIFHHLDCPMWEYFREKGEILCEDVCFPVVETITKEICKDVEMVVLQKPDEEHTCIKGLRKIT